MENGNILHPFRKKQLEILVQRRSNFVFAQDAFQTPREDIQLESQDNGRKEDEVTTEVSLAHLASLLFLRWARSEHRQFLGTDSAPKDY